MRKWVSDMSVRALCTALHKNTTTTTTTTTTTHYPPFIVFPPTRMSFADCTVMCFSPATCTPWSGSSRSSSGPLFFTSRS